MENFSNNFIDGRKIYRLNFELFLNAVKAAEAKGIKVKAGNILSADEFYGDEFDEFD